MLILLVTNILLNIVLCHIAQGANILYVDTMASPSHHIWNKELILGLVQKGHNVTSISHHSEPVPIKNWTIITIEGVYDALSKSSLIQAIADATVLHSMKVVSQYSLIVCEHELKSPELQILLDYPKDFFELIVFDTTLGQCMYPLIEWFNNPPVVGVYLMPLLISRSFGTHIYSSYMPHYTSGFSNEMSLVQRIANFIYMEADYLYFNYISLPAEYRLAQARFGQDINYLNDVEKNISLMLVNINSNSDYPISLPPNVIPVGGLHIKPAEKLPKDLQKLLDNAKFGAILVAFGTNVDPNEFKKDTQSALINAFGRLNQTIIWKYKANNAMAFPKNVVIREWLPQQDILGHPNLRLFVSHCGGLSHQEAIYHGVPIVAIPYFIDQRIVAQRLIKRKLAVGLEYGSLNADKIFASIQEVLNNPMYAENIKMVSKRYRDQPQTPLERGLFWIEYVLKYKNVENLVPLGRNMPRYQLENLDVYLFFVTLFILAYSIITSTFAFCKLRLSSIFVKKQK